MKKLLEGKTAIITGASKGIGLAIAQLYSEEGANVVMTARNKADLNSAVDSITKAGGKALGIIADAASAASCKEVFAKTIAAFGQVDIVVNNAGVGDQWMIEAVPDEAIDSIIGINLKGPFYYCREAVKHMLPRKEGVIINVSSVNGVRPMCGAAYTSTKGGLNILTKNIAIRLVGTGVPLQRIVSGLHGDADVDGPGSGLDGAGRAKHGADPAQAHGSKHSDICDRPGQRSSVPGE